jgi:hypothetical protein
MLKDLQDRYKNVIDAKKLIAAFFKYLLSLFLDFN